MDLQGAVEHASAVAREAFRAGLAERDLLRQLYQEYQAQLDDGPLITFTEFLLTRGEIDRKGFALLEATVPPEGPIPAHLRSSQASQTFQPSEALVAAQKAHDAAQGTADAGEDWTEAVPDASAERTVEFDDVLLQDSQEGSYTDFGSVAGFMLPESEVIPASRGEKTQEFQRVLKPGDKISEEVQRAHELEGALPHDSMEIPPEALPPGALLEDETKPYGTVLRKNSEDPQLDAFLNKRTGEFATILPPPSSSSSSDYEPIDPPLGLDSIAQEQEKEALGGTAAEPSHAFGYYAGLGGSVGFESALLEPDESDLLPIESEPLVGESIGPYKLERVLGRGGMGVIYRAQREGTEEPVALKVLLRTQEAGADRRRQRFRREFEALRRLEHPSIVRVHDYGRQGPFDWYTMDYVKGIDFEQALLRNRLSREECLVVFEDICRAIAHAHERKVVHRDLKPQNVIVDEEGRGHVLDFGLAKILDQGLAMTRTGSTLGTPFYMAPEQLESAGEADARTDVFALGVILYEISVGSRPFSGKTAAEVGSQILSKDPARPSRAKSGLPKELDAICLKALEKAPERRYRNGGELLGDLTRYRMGLRVTGGVGLGASARRWARRNRAALVGGIVASLFFVPAILFLLGKVLSGGAPPVSPPPEATASPTGE